MFPVLEIGVTKLLYQHLFLDPNTDEKKEEGDVEFMAGLMIHATLSAHSTRWWMNLRGEPAPVSIEIARETYTGKARPH